MCSRDGKGCGVDWLANVESFAVFEIPFVDQLDGLPH
jgi:hypothetical protein